MIRCLIAEHRWLWAPVPNTRTWRSVPCWVCMFCGDITFKNPNPTESK